MKTTCTTYTRVSPSQSRTNLLLQKKKSLSDVDGSCHLPTSDVLWKKEKKSDKFFISLAGYHFFFKKVLLYNLDLFF
jgi:hypothetical protein